ncbi:DUF86 domain-containing protein [Cellulomonas hominis]|uniref:HepT-like ribonuclease domain-containing protein n=1 Tax=Cellulomonas hominis TaxID=156981 RepID=UPI001C0F6545|nr:HepT-like ribonuclease domain-containing protein [Cellulomonas hominis]MBU5424750.1 DUF86 domain-containing protein [Cellulomonas hominis]
MRRAPADLVDDALEHLDAVVAYAARIDPHDQVWFDGLCLRLAAAIECLGELSPDLRDTVCGGSWPAVRATRNRIVHGYFAVDREVVLRAVADDVDPMRERLLGAARVLAGGA